MNADSRKNLGKILLIDDEEAFREVTGQLLLKHGFEFLAASDGREGLRRAGESLPDLILCDLLMPEMNGYAVLAALRDDERLAETPVIFLTAESEPAEVRRGMNLGAEDYLIKPASILDLVGAIKARLDRRQSERCRRAKQVKRARRLARRRLARQDAAALLADSPLTGSFLIKTLKEKQLVKNDEIKSIIAFGEYSRVYWDKSAQGVLLRKSLKRWQSELPSEQFIRVHRRAIVNLAFLDRVERLPAGRLQVHLRDMPEPILVSLSQTPILNRKLKSPLG